jgi:predicted nucleic acid-binding protein
MIYLDTSLLVALITNEARTARALDWLATVDVDLLTSEWAMAEIASAVSIKQRQRALDDVGRARAERTLSGIAGHGVDVVPVTTADFRRAADYVRLPERSLRAADALHLAVADRFGATVHTLDGVQVAAARQLGIDAVVTVERS